MKERHGDQRRGGARSTSEERSFLLVWDTNRKDYECLQKGAADLAEGAPYSERWSTGVRKDVPVGSRIFLMRLGREPKGIVASGYSSQLPEGDPDRERRQYVLVEWDHVHDLEAPLPLAVLRRLGRSVNWTPQSSGELPAAVAHRLERAWRAFVAGTSSAAEGGAGRLSDPKTRRAVEEYAMGRAERHFAEQGYEVVRRGKPFDLECQRGRELLRVEVKGTTTAGRTIELTPNEVSLHQSADVDMALFVTSGIELGARGRPHGGVDRVIHPWLLDERHLRPVAFEYRLPADE